MATHTLWVVAFKAFGGIFISSRAFKLCTSTFLEKLCSLNKGFTCVSPYVIF